MRQDGRPGDPLAQNRGRREAGGREEFRGRPPWSGRLIQVAKSAYQYPLIFKQLWHTPLLQAPDQEIVYRDLKRFTYRQIRERIGRLASALEQERGVVPGDTVGVLDWDSHRFLEAFFAIPMMGAVLQTVNVRLSPEQIAYTINHAGASTLLVNDEFVGLLEGIKPQLPKVKTVDRDVGPARAADRQPVLRRRIREPACRGFARLRLSRFRREHPGDHLLHDRHDRTAQGRLLQPPAARAALAVRAGVCSAWRAQQGRFSRDDVYMPITPMFHVHAWGFPWSATLAGVKQVYPGRYDPAMLVKLIKSEGVTFTHGVPTILQMLLNAAAAANVDLDGSQDGDRRLGLAEGAGQAGARCRHRHLRRLRHVGDRPARRRCPMSDRRTSPAIPTGRSNSAPGPAWPGRWWICASSTPT